MRHSDRWAALASSALVVSLIAVPGSRAAASFVVTKIPTGACVKSGSRTVVTLHTPNQGLVLVDRARLAVRRVQRFLREGGPPSAIRPRRMLEGAGVFAGGRLVVVATFAEAEAQHRTPWSLADEWARGLRTVIAPPPPGRMAPGTASSKSDVTVIVAPAFETWDLSRPFPATLAAAAPWKPSRPPQAQELPIPPSSLLRSTSSLVGSGGNGPARSSRVTVNFVRTDIVDVVNTLSLQQALNIALTPNAKGIVSVSLSNVTAEEALSLITRLVGLDYIQNEGTYVIGTPAELQAMAARAGGSAIRPLRYLSVQDAREILAGTCPHVTVRQAPGGSGVQLLGTRSDVAAACRVLQQADVTSAAAPLPIETVTPRHVESAELRDLLARVLPSLRVVQKGPALILCDTAASLEQARKVVAAVDVAVAERRSTFIYEVKFITADEARDALKGVLPNLAVVPGPAPYAPPAAQFHPLSTVLGGPSGAFQGDALAGTTTLGSGTGTPVGAAEGPGLLPRQSSRAPTIILVGTEGEIAQARAILEQTDVAPPQVLIEARVVELTPEASRALGISYPSPLADVTIREEGPAGGRGVRFGTFTRSPLSFRLTLNALLTRQLARLLASPSITVVNNEDANIFIGDLVKFISSQTTDVQGRLQFTIDTQPVGITLLVRPRVNADGEITIKLHPVVSTLIRGVTLPGGANLPQVRSREADTTVRLRDGEMLAIGGLISEEEIRAMERIPFLSDLP